MNPKVSVIVPIYNVEKYLNKCVDSIINQSLRDIEIILVDDGSTDNSGDIADIYAEKDSRVKVIHKENGGQGSARNHGIEVAQGEYIGFVDSDDWIDFNMYEELYIAAEKEEADIAVCNRKVFDENDNLKTIVTVSEGIIDINKDKIIDYVIDQLFYPHTVVVYNKIFKKTIISNNNITFKEVKEVGSEDALFNYEVLLNVEKIIEVNSTNHNQLAREGSTARIYKIGAMKRTSKLIEEIYKYSYDNNAKEIGDMLAPIMLLFFQQWNYNLIKTYGKDDFKKYITDEHKLIEKNKYLKRAEKDLIFDRRLNPYIKKMGYSQKGKLFMSIYMLLSLLGLNKLAASVRCMM